MPHIVNSIYGSLLSPLDMLDWKKNEGPFSADFFDRVTASFFYNKWDPSQSGKKAIGVVLVWQSCTAPDEITFLTARTQLARESHNLQQSTEEEVNHSWAGDLMTNWSLRTVAFKWKKQGYLSIIFTEAEKKLRYGWLSSRNTMEKAQCAID